MKDTFLVLATSTEEKSLICTDVQGKACQKGSGEERLGSRQIHRCTRRARSLERSGRKMTKKEKKGECK